MVINHCVKAFITISISTKAFNGFELIRSTSCWKLSREILSKLVKVYKTYLGKCIPAYDGNKMTKGAKGRTYDDEYMTMY